MFKKFFDNLANKVSDAIPKCDRCKVAYEVVSIIRPKVRPKHINAILHRYNLTCRTLCGVWQPKGLAGWSPEEVEKDLIPPVMTEALEWQAYMTELGITHEKCLIAIGTILPFCNNPIQVIRIVDFLKSENIVCSSCYSIFYKDITEEYGMSIT